jgi:hypothetical protein
LEQISAKKGGGSQGFSLEVKRIALFLKMKFFEKNVKGVKIFKQNERGKK